MGLAWHTAALTRVKRMPPLKSLQSRPAEAAAPKQRWQEQLIVMEQWMASRPKRKRG